MHSQIVFGSLAVDPSAVFEYMVTALVVSNGMSAEEDTSEVAQHQWTDPSFLSMYLINYNDLSIYFAIYIRICTHVCMYVCMYM